MSALPVRVSVRLSSKQCSPEIIVAPTCWTTASGSWIRKATTVAAPGVVKRAITASAIGNATEWFDYGIYAYGVSYNHSRHAEVLSK